MKILLAGDSWGIGVFTGSGNTYGPTGQGIQTILEAQGHTVTNISKGGGSNWLMIDRLEHRWGNTGKCLYGVNPSDRVAFSIPDYDYIVFLQTDVFRERHYYGKQYPTDTDANWKVLSQTFVDSLQAHDSLSDYINDYFKNFYTKLNSIGQQYNKQILCLGGWCQLHPSISEYSNLIEVVPSATKLLIPELNQDCYLNDPEWFIQLANDNKFMSKFGNEFKQLTVQNAEKLALVYRHWDEVHPDITGYELLVEKIQKYLL